MAFIRNNNNNGRRHNNNYNNRNRHHNNGQQSGQGGNQQRRFTNRANQVFDSSGPDMRVRGTAVQLVEKYSQLARDCSSRDDRVLMISYLQHAEHYQRLVNEIAEETAAQEREREAYRAQQGLQPETQAIEVIEGETSQPRTNEENAPPPRQQDRRNERRDDRRERGPRRAEDANAEDDNGLPSFLQPPAEPRGSESAAPRARAPARPRRTTPSDDAPPSEDL